MIHGIGTDLVQLSRIASTFQRFGDRFVHRILSAEEITEFQQYTRPKEQYLSSRWAVKEATYKALGFREIPFNDIHVLSSFKGYRSPIHIELCGKAKKAAEEAGITVSLIGRCSF
ncbi:hypothetical protein WA588_004213 [Blastocystis sp. NMH]